MKNKQQKFLFTMHLLLRSSQVWNLSVGLADRLTPGLTPNTQDPWGYTHVTDFDLDRNSPFLLIRSRP